ANNAVWDARASRMVSWCLGIARVALRVHDSRGHKILPAALENDSRQRTGRRPSQHRAVGSGKDASMTRAIEAIFIRLVVHGAGSVRANPAERYVVIARGAEQDARLDISRV